MAVAAAVWLEPSSGSKELPDRRLCEFKPVKAQYEVWVKSKTGTPKNGLPWQRTTTTKTAAVQHTQGARSVPGIPSGSLGSLSLFLFVGEVAGCPFPKETRQNEHVVSQIAGFPKETRGKS